MTHHPAADDIPVVPHLPEPAVGAASSDLQTTSDDPEELRRLLQLARERLAFYESFDRIVGENVRRSGELMLERSALREQAAANAARAERDRAARDAEAAASRESYRRLLGDLNRDMDTLRAGLDGLIDRLREAEAQLASDRWGDEQEQLASQPPPETAPAAPAPEQATAPADQPASEAPSPPPTAERPEDAEWDAPRVVELIAHGVPRAADALALQRHLGALDRVVGVEAREFAEGMLRLQIMARSPLPPGEIETWDGHPGMRVLQHGATVIELDWGAAPA